MMAKPNQQLHTVRRDPDGRPSGQQRSLGESRPLGQKRSLGEGQEHRHQKEAKELNLYGYRSYADVTSAGVYTVTDEPWCEVPPFARYRIAIRILIARVAETVAAAPAPMDNG